MINPLGGIWLIYILYRAIAGWQEGSRGTPPRVGGTPERNALFRPISVDGRHLLVWFLGGLAVIVAAVWFTQAPVVSALVFGVATIFLAPWLYTRCVLIPLGLMRASAVAARLALWTFRYDAGEGASSLAAALALAHQRHAKERDVAWLADRLAEPSRWPMRGATIAAHAMLAMVRGDQARALCLFESVEMLHPLAAPRIARRLAARYRMAAAAAREDWESVARLAAAYRRLTRTAWFYGALAAWHRGHRSASSAIRLRFFWAVAPRRRRSWMLVANALAPVTVEALGASVPVEPPAWPHAVIAPFDEALRRHAALAITRNGPGLGEAWCACASAWQKVFDDGTSAEQAITRGKELGIGEPQQLLGVFGSLVRADLASEALRPGVGHEDLSRGGPLGAWVIQHLGEEDLRDLDYRAGALEEPHRAGTLLPIVEDWAELAAIRSRLEQSADRLGDLYLRAAFGVIQARVGNHAARMFNLRNERPIANAAFRWLARCAERAGDDQALANYRGNVSLGF
jgi:hypothetical protein